MAIGRAARRIAREPAVIESFGPTRAGAALDLLELTELAWHDCYGEVTPPDSVIEDILVVASGDLGELVSAARMSVDDFRDLHLNSEAIRSGLRRRPRTHL